MEKLEIEFRYTDSNKNRDDYIIRNRFVTIGLFDTIEEAVIKGNEALKLLSDKGFEVRVTDRFKVKGLFGNPNRLVSNTVYNDKVTYFAKITNLSTNNINDIIEEAFKGCTRYNEYKIKEAQEELY